MVHILAMNVHMEGYLKLLMNTSVSKNIDSDIDNKSNTSESESTDSEIDEFIHYIHHTYKTKLIFAQLAKKKPTIGYIFNRYKNIPFDIQSPPPRAYIWS
jgi:hypothetical protein